MIYFLFLDFFLIFYSLLSLDIDPFFGLQNKELLNQNSFGLKKRVPAFTSAKNCHHCSINFDKNNKHSPGFITSISRAY